MGNAHISQKENYLAIKKVMADGLESFVNMYCSRGPYACSKNEFALAFSLYLLKDPTTREAIAPFLAEPQSPTNNWHPQPVYNVGRWVDFACFFFKRMEDSSVHCFCDIMVGIKIHTWPDIIDKSFRYEIALKPMSPYVCPLCQRDQYEDEGVAMCSPWFCGGWRKKKV